MLIRKSEFIAKCLESSPYVYHLTQNNIFLKLTNHKFSKGHLKADYRATTDMPSHYTRLEVFSLSKTPHK